MRTRADDEFILAQYELWDPAKETVDEFAVRIGTSKPTLYTVLKRNDVSPKLRRSTRSDHAGIGTDPLLKQMGEQAVKVMLEEIQDLARRLETAERETERLQKALERLRSRR